MRDDCGRAVALIAASLADFGLGDIWIGEEREGGLVLWMGDGFSI